MPISAYGLGIVLGFQVQITGDIHYRPLVCLSDGWITQKQLKLHQPQLLLAINGKSHMVDLL